MGIANTVRANATASRKNFVPGPATLKVADRLSQKVFNGLYSRSLVYNACWEDPAVDRKALRIGADDTVLVITSAGCNALDYALDGPKRIHAVDANPRQTALLELKLAGIRALDYEDFFAVFGHGYHPHFAKLYRGVLRQQLSDFARTYWDRFGKWFASRHGSFYYHGLAGFVARGFKVYFRLRPQLASRIDDLFECSDLADQRAIYDMSVAPELWTPTINWILNRNLTMSLIGVPQSQRQLVQSQHPDGVSGFVRKAVDYVFRHLPVGSNYFWRVYLYGHYTRDCCPEYLSPSGFQALKGGLVDCIDAHTCTVTEFLHSTSEPVSRFVLLDHMDWMSTHDPATLNEEWTAILSRARPGARILLRSAQEDPEFLRRVVIGDQRMPLQSAVRFQPALAAQLQYLDRVHTYAGFVIADVPA